MSIFSSIVKKIAPIAATVGRFIPGIGTTLSMAGTAATAYYAAKSAVPAAPAPTFTPQIVPMPGVGSMQAGMFPSFPTSLTRALPALAGVGGAAVRVGVAGAKRVYQSAASYCRKHPGWCQTIGGIAAVESMIQSGQLPAMKSRRGRGITATELKNFKRVARFTSKYCAPVRRAMSAPAVRRKSCR